MNNPTIEQIAAMAWDLVKADDDPPFSNCLLDHQQKLIYHARDVQRTGRADDVFEAKVAEILDDPAAAIAALKTKLGLAEAEALPPVPDTKPLPKAVKPKRGKS